MDERDHDLLEPLHEEGGHKHSRARRQWIGRQLRRATSTILLLSLALALITLYHLPSQPVVPHADAIADVERAKGIREFRRRVDVAYPPTEFFREGRQRNDAALGELAACMETNTCRRGQKTVVVLASHNFGNALRGAQSGENIWAMSMIKAFEALGYTLLYTYGAMDTLFTYQHMGDLIPILLWEGSQLKACIARNASSWEALESGAPSENVAAWPLGREGCMYDPSYPSGVPWWKSFAFHFWASSATPWLGGQWTLSPEEHGGSGSENQYIGYSIEDKCREHSPYYTRREHRALVLGKQTRYFEAKENLFFGLVADAAASVAPDRTSDSGSLDGADFKVISTAGKKGEVLAEPGIETTGKMSREEWIQTLARSKVLLGIGNPPLSPSPYDALCAGVPFINPVSHWDHKNHSNRTSWTAQQQALVDLDEPYVYHVRKGDKYGLSRALRQAAAHPIDRYIPPKMRMAAVRERQRALVERDWRAAAVESVKKLYPGDEGRWAYLHEPAAGVWTGAPKVVTLG